MSYVEKIQAPGPKKILALDGGGIRGMMTVEILCGIEGMLRKALGRGEDFVLEQDRAGFLARTNLPALRSNADIRVTTPGQYQRLMEHIDVHRWYLGVERNSEILYSDAVTSWFDNVYQPLVQLIREQNLLAYFPGRTEADLYLWFINRQNVLKEAYSEREPPQPPEASE